MAESVTQIFYIYNFLRDKLNYYILDSTYVLTVEVVLTLRRELRAISTSGMDK